jgi:hypothetical protein
MIEKLIDRVFLTRGYTHLAHWKTHSYAEHVALGDFYDEIVDGLDKLVEAFQGIFGIVDDICLSGGDCPKDIVKHLSEELTWINNNSTEITNDIATLDNILQELQAMYMKVLYKLKNLN